MNASRSAPNAIRLEVTVERVVNRGPDGAIAAIKSGAAGKVIFEMPLGERSQVAIAKPGHVVVDREKIAGEVFRPPRPLERFADRLVLEQAVARLHPVLGVEHLALRPHGDDAYRPQERREHEEDDHAGALHAAIVASPG